MHCIIIIKQNLLYIVCVLHCTLPYCTLPYIRMSWTITVHNRVQQSLCCLVQLVRSAGSVREIGETAAEVGSTAGDIDTITVIVCKTLSPMNGLLQVLGPVLQRSLYTCIAANALQLAWVVCES